MTLSEEGKNKIKIINFSDRKRTVKHDLCQSCSKNGVTCNENDNTCLPLEMFVQLSKETSMMKKIEYLDNVADWLDLKNSF